MGQGQEAPAMATLVRLAADGGWVMLQNVHLMQGWLPMLERKLEIAAEIVSVASPLVSVAVGVSSTTTAGSQPLTAVPPVPAEPLVIITRYLSPLFAAKLKSASDRVAESPVAMFVHDPAPPACLCHW
jgi:hypothetical protein